MNRKAGGGQEKVIELAAHAERKRRRQRRPFVIFLGALVILALGGWLYLRLQTYTEHKILSEQFKTEGTNGSYESFGDGFLRYTSNGVQFLDKEQNVSWEYSYEMNNPEYTGSEKTAAIYDVQGNQIQVFDLNGFLGKIRTAMPIQMVCVSENGITAVILQNEEQTKLMLFDTEGNTLVEGRISFLETGYPVAIAISPNGQRLLVSYVTVENSMASHLVGYDFSDPDADDEERIILDDAREDLFIPVVGFMGNKNCYAVGTGTMLFYGGSRSMSIRNEVEVETQIKSVLTESDAIGIVTSDLSGEKKYVISLYNGDGHKTRSMKVDEEYNKISMKDEQVFLLNGKHCTIYRTSGHCVFSGTFDSNVTAIVPDAGILTYQVVEDDRVIRIRLRK